MTRAILSERLLKAGLASLCVATTFLGAASAAEERTAQLHQVPQNQDVVAPWTARQPGTPIAQKIVAADRLRSLSRELSALACHVTQDVAPQHSRKQLQRVSTEFNSALQTLQDDASADRVAMQKPSPEAFAEVAAVKEMWLPVEDAIKTISETPGDAAALSMLGAGGEVLHDLSSLLFTKVKTEFTKPAEVKFRDGLLIDVAGQQAVLTHQISYTACQIWGGDRSAKRMKEFSDAAWMLDRGLASLVHGLPSMGIVPAPNEEIRAELQVALREWRSLKVFVVGMTESTVPGIARRLLYERLYEEQERLSGIVQLYADHSKQLY